MTDRHSNQAISGMNSLRSLGHSDTGFVSHFFLIRVVGSGVHTGSTRHVVHFWPVVPVPGVFVRMENLVE
jgi:hypothetical protein